MAWSDREGSTRDAGVSGGSIGSDKGTRKLATGPIEEATIIAKEEGDGGGLLVVEFPALSPLGLSGSLNPPHSKFGWLARLWLCILYQLQTRKRRHHEKHGKMANIHVMVVHQMPLC